MSRGWPTGYGRGAAAVATRSAGSLGSSYAGLGAGVMRLLPRLPPPSPAAIGGAIVAGILAGVVNNSVLNDGETPAPLGPTHLPPGLIPNPRLTRVDYNCAHPDFATQFHSNYEGTRLSSYPTTTFSICNHASYSTFMTGSPEYMYSRNTSIVPTDGIPMQLRDNFAQQIFGTVKYGVDGNGIYKTDFRAQYGLVNLTGDRNLPPAVNRPPVYYPPVPSKASTAVGASAGDGTGKPGAGSVGKAATIPITNRGVGITIGTAPTTVVNPMNPMREIKGHATGKVMEIIRKTVGEMGEAIDATRCFQEAVGNTYGPGDRVIPKSQWMDALAALASGTESTWTDRDKGRKRITRRFSKATPEGVVTSSGALLSWGDVGERLTKCLFINFLEDTAIGLQGEAIKRMQRDLGLTVGPLGYESLYEMFVNGSLPYEHALTLGLG